MADGGYIREYLVGLGFEVDERGLDAFRAATGETLLTGVPLVCGEGAAMDLLRQLSYLAIGRAACVPVSDGLARDRPGETALGTDFELCWEG